MMTSQAILEKSQITYKLEKKQPFLDSTKVQISKKAISNNSMTSCVRINFVTNNIYCTF
jgi:hypothetical protein